MKQSQTMPKEPSTNPADMPPDLEVKPSSAMKKLHARRGVASLGSQEVHQYSTGNSTIGGFGARQIDITTISSVLDRVRALGEAVGHGEGDQDEKMLALFPVDSRDSDLGSSEAPMESEPAAKTTDGPVARLVEELRHESKNNPLLWVAEDIRRRQVLRSATRSPMGFASLAAVKGIWSLSDDDARGFLDEFVEKGLLQDGIENDDGYIHYRCERKAYRVMERIEGGGEKGSGS